MSILNLALQYNKFQNDFGSNDASYQSEIDQLFTSDFQKIANKNSLVSGKDELESQLKSVKEFAGNWLIVSIYNIPSKDDKSCTIRYELHSEKAGNFDVMAILSSENGKQINKVDEVFCKL